MINGIKGGRLTLEKAKDMVLFNFKKMASVITKTVCKPQSGDKPINVPKAMENAFFFGESSLPKRSSTKKRFSPFFLYF